MTVFVDRRDQCDLNQATCFEDICCFFTTRLRNPRSAIVLHTDQALLGQLLQCFANGRTADLKGLAERVFGQAGAGAQAPVNDGLQQLPDDLFIARGGFAAGRCYV